MFLGKKRALIVFQTWHNQNERCGGRRHHSRLRERGIKPDLSSLKVSKEWEICWRSLKRLKCPLFLVQEGPNSSRGCEGMLPRKNCTVESAIFLLSPFCWERPCYYGQPELTQETRKLISQIQKQMSLKWRDNIKAATALIWVSRLFLTAANQVGQTKKGGKKSTFFCLDESGEKLKKLEKFLILTFSWEMK